MVNLKLMAGTARKSLETWEDVDSMMDEYEKEYLAACRQLWREEYGSDPGEGEHYTSVAGATCPVCMVGIYDMALEKRCPSCTRDLTLIVDALCESAVHFGAFRAAVYGDPWANEPTRERPLQLARPDVLRERGGTVAQYRKELFERYLDATRRIAARFVTETSE